MRNCERGVATRAALGNYRFLSKYTSINCVAQHFAPPIRPAAVDLVTAC